MFTYPEIVTILMAMEHMEPLSRPDDEADQRIVDHRQNILSIINKLKPLNGHDKEQSKENHQVR